MKVLDLCCTNEHRFEGWFKSDADFETQAGAGMIVCPLCEATAVTRMPSAPRLNLSGASAPQSARERGDNTPAHMPAQQSAGMTAKATQAQAAWLAALRRVVADTEDVGERFADEARKMHYDEAPARNIRGVASREQMHELLDEGIDVLPLALPSALKDPLQ